MNAITGKLLESECNERYIPTKEDYITEKQAIEIALETIPKVMKISRDKITDISVMLIYSYDNPKYIVHFKINGESNGYACPVDALTGNAATN